MSPVKHKGLYQGLTQTSLYLTAIEDDEGDNRLVQLELARKADGVASPDPMFNLAIAATAVGILMRISAEQMLSMHRTARR